MAPRRYLNFDLLLDQEGEASYQALVTGSPLGETPSVRFRLPFDATTLENLLLKLDPGRSGTRRVGASPQQQAAMDFGGPLFEAIFSNELLLAWSRSQDEAREQGDGLRLRLRLNDAPAIAGLPWELLYDERVNAFIAQSERTPVVRFLDLPSPPRPISVDGPLRVLVVISSPTDLEELDVEAEWGRIQEALAPRLDDRVVQIDRLPEATLTELGRWLRRHPTHVIHFVGHGDFDERLGEGVIYFQDSRGRSKAVTSSVLGPFLRDHDPLRMVVLNACRSARTDMRDPFGGMAQGLVQQDATAVIAMQFPISDRAAVAFTGAFYGALVDGLPVDQASSSARKALLADFADEWATPVLFLRAPDGDIFRQVHAPEDDDATQVDAPPVDAPTVVEPTQPEPTQPEPTRGPEAVADSGAAEDTRATPLEEDNVPTAGRPPRGFTYVHPVPPTAPPKQPPPARPPASPTRPSTPPAGSAPVAAATAAAGTEQRPRPTATPPPAKPSGPRVDPRLLGAAAGGVLLVVLATVALFWFTHRGGGGDTGDEGGGADTTATSLPTSDPLTDSQLLVAAGVDQNHQHLWLLDADDPETAIQVTRGSTREWIPALSPDRRTVLFARLASGDKTPQLMVAGAADGSGVRPFFPEGPPEECAGKVLRPAWFADGHGLVLPCTDRGGRAHLVVVDLDGRLTDRLDPTPEVGALATIGDPTLSSDGSTVVVWANADAPAAGGSLYRVDVESGAWALVRAGTGEEYSDAVFSEDGQLLAFRRDVGAGNYQVVVARVDESAGDGSGLGDDTVVADDPGKDQDPMFSPDSSEVVYGHVNPEENTLAEELRVVGVDGGAARTLPPPPGLDYLSVPAWSRR